VRGSLNECCGEVVFHSRYGVVESACRSFFLVGFMHFGSVYGVGLWGVWRKSSTFDDDDEIGLG